MRWIGVIAALVLTTPARADERASTHPARLRPAGRTATCVGPGCHEGLVDRKVVHGPVAQRKCQACHAEADPQRHTFKDAMPRERLCVGCHVLPVRDVVHKPVAVGDCTGCHDPHGSDQRRLLRGDPATQACLGCHEGLGYREKPFVHGPVAAGVCIACHDAHSSWNAGLLRQRPQELCATCHAPVIESLASRRHAHRAVAEGACTDCHDPHASDFRGQLKGDGVSLCLDCHEPLRHVIETSRVMHGPILSAEGCAACHVGHASDLPALQRAAQPAGCLGCHDRPLRDAAGHDLTDMAAWLKDHPNHHGPIRDRNCTACHDPHASQNFRLLAADYPPEFYAPFDAERYRLCFTCHRSELATSESGRGVTNFRDGDRNLHYVHVHQEKGRTCRACHEVHASKRPFHMRESTPFGASNWMLEINFESSDAGGSCAPGCHKPAAYDRRDEASSAATRPRGAGS